MIRILALLAAIFATLPAAMATDAGWALLQGGGQVVLLRNAFSSGAAEPADFDITNCRKQIGLDERGRLQAREIGAIFAARAADTDKVLSSRLCRCIETAKLAFGDVEPNAALDPPAAEATSRAAQRAAVLKIVGAYSEPGNLVMVVSQETLTLLAGVTAREGEAIIVRPEGGGLRVAGRVIFH